MTTDVRALIRDELTEAQAAAALDPHNEVLCLACAGSGKSQTLAYRVARLLREEVDPTAIVVFTFTEKAAESIKRRISQVLVKTGISVNLIGRMYVGTIHAFCQNLLGKADAQYRQYDVLDDNRLNLFLMSRYAELRLQAIRGPRCGGRYFETVEQVGGAWKLCQDEIVDLAAVTAADPALGGVLERLKQCLEHDQYLDFGSMIRRVVDHVRDGKRAVLEALGRVRHLLVDEYQDVSPSQEALIRAIHAGGASLFVVGDDDQAIYAWRGADVSNILEFDARYSLHESHIHTLDTNFRSTRAIVQVSADFIAQELGAQRHSKNPVSHRDARPREMLKHLFPDRDSEAEWVAGRIAALVGTEFTERDGTVRGLTCGDIAILMRSTRVKEQSGEARHHAFTVRLAALGIPFSLEAGGNPFDRPQVAVLRAVFRMLADGIPDRPRASECFDTLIRPAYPAADFRKLAAVLTEWGRNIHTSAEGVRQRLFPQRLVFDLLAAFGVADNPPAPEIFREIGLFSRMIQDVESVYLSVDSTRRFQDVANFLDCVAEGGYNTSTDEVTQRPDAVSVATVHSVKGLEFPVVFLVDCQSGRFPRSRSGYEGLLPPDLMRAAIAREAYIGTQSGEARLFYTALTRAEAFLYVTGASHLPGGRRPNRESKFACRLRDRELLNDPAAVADDLPKAPPVRKVDDTVLPTSFSDVRYYLHCPMDYRFRREWGFSPPVPELFGFGRAVHVAVEKLHEVYSDGPPTAEEAAGIAHSTFHLKHVAPSEQPDSRPGPYERARNKSVEIARAYALEFSDDFVHRRQVEARFEIPAQDCLITGSIDLLFHESREGMIRDAQVIDFKAMEASDGLSGSDLDWLALSLQVQLYAKAAREVLGENAATGSVHLLKDNRRIDVPIDEAAVRAAVENVEWGVRGIVARHFPMRPHPDKCPMCDFKTLCQKTTEEIDPKLGRPPAVLTPRGPMMARAVD